MKQVITQIDTIETEFWNEDIYNDSVIDDFLDNDSISSAEQGFMIGYMGA